MVSLLYDNITVIGMTWIFGITGILTNSLVLIKIIVHSKKFQRFFTKNCGIVNRMGVKLSSKSKIFTILIISLTSSDLMGSFYLLILALADVRYRFIVTNTTSFNNSSTAISSVYALWLRDPFCYIARFISIATVCQSSITTWLIAFDRYSNVFYPYSINSRLLSKRIFLISIASLMSSLLISTIVSILASMTVPLLPLSKSFRYHNLCTIDNLEYFYIKITLITLILIGTANYISVVCMYCAILYKIRRNRSRVRNIASITTSSIVYQKIEKKILYTTATICCTNCLTWFPSITFSFITVLDYGSVDQDGLYQSIVVLISIAMQANCCINPILLLLSSRNNMRLFLR